MANKNKTIGQAGVVQAERSAKKDFAGRHADKAPQPVRYAFPLCARDKAFVAVAGLVKKACDACGFPVSFEDAKRSLGSAARPEFGDVACKIAFDLTVFGKPNEVAQKIAEALAQSSLVEKVEVKGPYVNFYFSQEFFALALREVLELRGEFGRGLASAQMTLVEYPSVNPNKPWHIGHLRNAVLGDCTARLVAFAGQKTLRVNYIDDLGLQVAQSIWGYLNLESNVEGKADHWFGMQYVQVAKLFEEAEFELKVKAAFDAVKRRVEKPDAGSVAEKFCEQNELGREEEEGVRLKIVPVLEKLERGEELGKVCREVRALVHELEAGETALAQEARRVTEMIVAAQQSTAFSLGMIQDVLVWESDIVHSHLLERGLRHLTEEGAIETTREGPKAGCVVAKLRGVEQFAHLEDPDKILVRSDGTATYTGKDVCLQLWKFGLMPVVFKFKDFLLQPDGSVLSTSCRDGVERELGKSSFVVNVIGAEQKYPQATIAHVLKAIGHAAESENSIHLAYEHAELPEAKMSGRKGTWVGFTADDVISEAVRRARVEVDKRFPEMGLEERERISQDVGVGAVRYGFIRTSPERKLVFDWDKALSFEENSAPYLQYTHARACRILEKAGVSFGDKRISEAADFSLLVSPEERKLVRVLSLFPSEVSTAANDFRPHNLCVYLFDLAESFNSFYKQSRVLQAETEELKQARLALVQASIVTLRNTLEILGIPAPEKM